MKFNSAYDNHPELGAQEFSEEQPTYGYFLDDLGNRQFGVTGTENVYALIQRDKDNTDWSILKKYLFDTYDGKDVGIYGDRSIEPKDIIEAGEFMEQMQKKFDNLPDVIKNKYKDVMSLVYGFNEEDFKLFENSPSTDISGNISNKGGGEDAEQ